MVVWAEQKNKHCYRTAFLANMVVQNPDGNYFCRLLYGIYRWRTATLRKQKRILEQTVKERTAEVVKTKRKIR